MCEGGRQTDRADLDMSAEKIVELLGSALVGHVLDVDARLHLEQLHREMMRPAGARRTVAELAGPLLGEPQQIGELPPTRH